jgi:hypothetical protein
VFGCCDVLHFDDDLRERGGVECCLLVSEIPAVKHLGLVCLFLSFVGCVSEQHLFSLFSWTPQPTFPSIGRHKKRVPCVIKVSLFRGVSSFESQV